MRITTKLVELIKKIKIVTKSAEFRRILIRFTNSTDFIISAINARSAISNFIGTFQICRCSANVRFLNSSLITTLDKNILILIVYTLI